MIKHFSQLVPDKLTKIFLDNNIQPVIVGGSIRDYFIDPSLDNKDIDIELYGDNLNTTHLLYLLSDFQPNLVGKSFGVIKITYDSIEYDISLPRTETSTGNKHTELDISTNSSLSYKEAFIRRDFTMNSIGFNLADNSFIDEFNGINDITSIKTIKHVNDKTFIEDPLRLFRAIQFSSRFNFEIDFDTKKLIHNMVENNLIDSLPKERIFIEFNKILLKSEKPSIAISLLLEFNILEKYFPELFELIGIPQSPIFHPEGDVFTHTLMALDKMATIHNPKPHNKLIHMYATLCHDMGKVDFTQITEDKITSRGHEEGGVKPTLSFMLRLTNDTAFIRKITGLVECHLRPTLLFNDNNKNGKIKNGTLIKLNNKLYHRLDIDIIDLALVNKADSLGRTTEKALSNSTPQFDWIVARFKSINFKKTSTRPLIKGQQLIELGLTPDKSFKTILKQCFDHQLDNDIEDTNIMISFLKSLLKK